MEPPPNESRVLEDARARARKLVEGLVRTRDELELPSRGLTPEQIAEGKVLLGNALRSAAQLLLALEDTAGLTPRSDPSGPPEES